jgi:parallel beta-helix repeat protein
VLVGPGKYVENIVVDKPSKVVSTNRKSATVVKATNTSKDVFLLSGSDITIQGFTVTSGKMGVVFGQTSNCVLTACVVNGNVFGAYLAGATGNLVSNNNLNGNVFGVYLDGSCGNKLSNNTGSTEKGGGGNACLGDRIYMFNSNANYVTPGELSNKQNYGVSLLNSENNAFSNNMRRLNAQFGVRLRDGADSNKFSFNTFRANAENCVLIGDSQANTFHLNNFLAEKSNFYMQEGNNCNSIKGLAYTYSGNVFTGFVGNYHSNYVGSDGDRNGIGDTPFSQDKYTLIKPDENYGMVQPTPTPTASPSTAASTTSTAYENTTAPTVGQRALAAVPRFETVTAIFGLLFATVIAVVLKRMR